MIDVLLLQLPVPSSPALNTPLAAGYLAAYAEARAWADEHGRMLWGPGG